jgi:hypothetical protein
MVPDLQSIYDDANNAPIWEKGEQMISTPHLWNNVTSLLKRAIMKTATYLQAYLEADKGVIEYAVGQIIEFNNNTIPGETTSSIKTMYGKYKFPGVWVMEDEGLASVSANTSNINEVIGEDEIVHTIDASELPKHRHELNLNTQATIKSSTDRTVRELTGYCDLNPILDGMTNGKTWQDATGIISFTKLGIPMAQLGAEDVVRTNAAEQFFVDARHEHKITGYTEYAGGNPSEHGPFALRLSTIQRSRYYARWIRTA